MYYNWIYTTSNENSYILFLIIVILAFIIINFNLWKKKTDKFDDVTIPNTIPNTTEFNIANQPSSTFTHITEPQLYLTSGQINPSSLSYGISKLDGDQESIATHTSIQNSNGNNNSNNNNNINNDIMQSKSSLYTSILTGKSSFQSSNYASIGNYATLDSVGTSMTDTLGGIKSNLGYAILDDQLGTFTPIQQNNPYAYDNTASYQTGMNPNTVNGTSSYSGGGGCGGYGRSPVFLQKDFTGVANIFAPNIIIANPPLTSDGLPDISFKM